MSVEGYIHQLKNKDQKIEILIQNENCKSKPDEVTLQRLKATQMSVKNQLSKYLAKMLPYQDESKDAV